MNVTVYKKSANLLRFLGRATRTLGWCTSVSTSTPYIRRGRRDLAGWHRDGTVCKSGHLPHHQKELLTSQWESVAASDSQFQGQTGSGSSGYRIRELLFSAISFGALSAGGCTPFCMKKQGLSLPLPLSNAVSPVWE